MRNRGFTMIELLVVMAILGAMIAYSAASYIGSLQRGRNSRRIEDVKQIQKGFEMYYSIEGSYAACATMFGETKFFPSGEIFSSDQTDYLKECDADEYTVCALMEVTKSGKNEANATCTEGALPCNFASSNQTHFCVKSTQ